MPWTFATFSRLLDAKHGRNAMPALLECDDDEKVPDMPSLVRQESGPVEEV
jgi:hypothetical protein